MINHDANSPEHLRESLYGTLIQLLELAAEVETDIVISIVSPEALNAHGYSDNILITLSDCQSNVVDPGTVEQSYAIPEAKVNIYTLYGVRPSEDEAIAALVYEIGAAGGDKSDVLSGHREITIGPISLVAAEKSIVGLTDHGDENKRETELQQQLGLTTVSPAEGMQLGGLLAQVVSDILQQGAAVAEFVYGPRASQEQLRRLRQELNDALVVTPLIAPDNMQQHFRFSFTIGPNDAPPFRTVTFPGDLITTCAPKAAKVLETKGPLIVRTTYAHIIPQLGKYHPTIYIVSFPHGSTDERRSIQIIEKPSGLMTASVSIRSSENGTTDERRPLSASESQALATILHELNALNESVERRRQVGKFAALWARMRGMFG